MATDVIKGGHKSIPELKVEMSLVDRTLGKIDTRTADLDERIRQLREAKRAKCEKEDAELKEIRREQLELQTMHSEAVGGRKMVIGLLKKLGAQIDESVSKGGRMLHQSGGKS
jgi:hypothetical protein